VAYRPGGSLIRLWRISSLFLQMEVLKIKFFQRRRNFFGRGNQVSPQHFRAGENPIAKRESGIPRVSKVFDFFKDFW